MDEYIEREAATQAAVDYFWNTQVVLLGTSGIAKAINDIHAADVAPVVHGRWRFVRDDALLTAECDKCYTVQSGALAALWDYCPNCGARMDGE